MLKSISIRNFQLACSADCPADNHARQLAQFLYETLPKTPLTNKTQENKTDSNKTDF